MVKSAALRFWTQSFDVQPDAREAMQLSVALWLGVAGFLIVGALAVGNLQNLGEFLAPVINTLSAILLAYGLVLVVTVLAGRPRWIASVTIPMAVLACAAAMTGADYATSVVIHELLLETRIPPSDPKSLFTVMAIYFCVYASNMALIGLTSVNRAMRLQAVRLETAEADGLRAELELLRLKLNPHFMFNALSAADGLIESGRHDEARQMVQRLSGFLRASFDVGVGDVSVDEELSLVGDYLEVERVRFADRLRVAVTVEPGLEHTLIPSMLLQPLVENAIKYGVGPSTRPVTVAIRVHRVGQKLRVEVENSGDDAPALAAGGQGVGEGATRSRLALRYDDQAVFSTTRTETGYLVQITLPLEDAAAA